jgi:inositol phosphorylceramide synthase catalytic subunit
VPSLHVAYPLLMAIDGFRRHRWFGRVLLVWFYLSMCFAAVYLDHHWVFDIVLGSVYTVAIATVMRRVLSSHIGLELPRVPSREVAE